MFHWQKGAATSPNYAPPGDIGSDYYPALGAYSSLDPKVVDQHFAWLREAGLGVAATSWWGRGEQQAHEHPAVPRLLEAGERHEVQVAFHIEPYPGPTADSLVEDVEHIVGRYGDSPAFCRVSAPTRWSPDNGPKALIFVWLIEFDHVNGNKVEADYWREAMDSIHALPGGEIVIANTLHTDCIDGEHFDGLYDYATPHLDQDSSMRARGLPPGAWYAHFVLLGFQPSDVDMTRTFIYPVRVVHLRQAVAGGAWHRCRARDGGRDVIQRVARRETDRTDCPGRNQQAGQAS